MNSTRIVLAFAYAVIALAVAFVVGGVIFTLAQSAPAPVGDAVPHTAAEVQACFDYADALDGEGAYAVCTTDAAAYDAWKVEIYHAR